jgi:hypothetical protein
MIERATKIDVFMMRMNFSLMAQDFSMTLSKIRTKKREISSFFDTSQHIDLYLHTLTLTLIISLGESMADLQIHGIFAKLVFQIIFYNYYA